MSSPDRVEGYVRALFEVAKVEGSLEDAEDELFRFARVLETSSDLRLALDDPGLPPEKREAIVEDLLGRKASRLTTMFLSLLVGMGRGKEIDEIVERFVERAASERRHEVAEVRSATPLDDDQRRRLAEALSASLGKQVEVKVIVDPSVIGGVMARVGDTVIDGTVRHRLEQLRATL